MKRSFLNSVITILSLCILIGGISIFFATGNPWTGPMLITLGVVCLLPLRWFKVTVRESVPDIAFGVIDNGILAIFALYGAYFGGIAGAILGGVVGNSITDGIAGIAEGYFAESSQESAKYGQRNALTSAIGKMAGCLFGAGGVMLVAQILEKA